MNLLLWGTEINEELFQTSFSQSIGHLPHESAMKGGEIMYLPEF